MQLFEDKEKFKFWFITLYGFNYSLTNDIFLAFALVL